MNFVQIAPQTKIKRVEHERLSGRQTNGKVGQFCLPIKSANKNLSSVVQKSAEFVCH